MALIPQATLGSWASHLPVVRGTAGRNASVVDADVQGVVGQIASSDLVHHQQGQRPILQEECLQQAAAVMLPEMKGPRDPSGFTVKIDTGVQLKSYATVCSSAILPPHCVDISHSIIMCSSGLLPIAGCW